MSTGTWEGNLSGASSQATLESPGQTLKAQEVSRQFQVLEHIRQTQKEAGRAALIQSGPRVVWISLLTWS